MVHGIPVEESEPERRGNGRGMGGVDSRQESMVPTPRPPPGTRPRTRRAEGVGVRVPSLFRLPVFERLTLVTGNHPCPSGDRPGSKTEVRNQRDGSGSVRNFSDTRGWEGR